MQLHATSIFTHVLFHFQSSQSLTGGLFPIALTRHFAILAVFDGDLNRIQFAQRVHWGFTKHTTRDQSSFSAKISYISSAGFASQSLMFWQSRYCLLISYPQVSWVKECFIEETCAKPFFCFGTFGNVFKFSESWPHKWWSPFWVKISQLFAAKRFVFFPTLLCFPTFVLSGYSGIPDTLHYEANSLGSLKKLSLKFPTISLFSLLSIPFSSLNSKRVNPFCQTPIVKGSDCGQTPSRQPNVPITSCLDAHTKIQLLNSLKLKNTWFARSASQLSVTCTSWRMEHYRREMGLMLSAADTTVGMVLCHAKCVAKTKRTLSTYTEITQ